MSLDVVVNMGTLRQERDGLLIGPYESEHVMVTTDLDYILMVYVCIFAISEECSLKTIRNLW